MVEVTTKTITKSKSYDNIITLNDLKSHLRLDSGYTNDDQLLTTLIEVAMVEIENFLEADVVPTTITGVTTYFKDFQSVYTESPLNDILSISTTSNSVETPITSYQLLKKHDRFTIFFDTVYNVNELKVVFTAGFDPMATTGVTNTNIPAPILQCLKIKVSDLYDNETNDYLLSAFKPNKVVERLLTPYKRIYMA